MKTSGSNVQQELNVQRISTKKNGAHFQYTSRKKKKKTEIDINF